LKYGDNLWTNHKLILLTETHHDTNGYYRYLRLQNIYIVSFLYPNQILKIDSNKTFYLDYQYYIYVLKEKLSRLFNKDIRDKNAVGLAMALLYGNRTELDKSLLNAYTQTGVVHIIAVSGMHVSLLYGLIILLWNIFGKVMNLKPIYKVWVVGIFMGMFTALAGFTPSILRASLVFGILLWGEYKHKTIYNYNNLAAAGWILLWLKPTNIYDLGYQLSFLAVLGIMLYARPLEKLLFFKNSILKQIWLCITLCVAAQLTTFPLIVYYFKQFPLLFIYTNIIIIFWSTIILYLIIVLVLVSWLPLLSTWVGWLIKYLTLVMNAIVLYFQKIPYSSMHVSGFSVYGLWMIYGGLFIITYWVYRRIKAI
ncbi:MAG: ComEC/Rec2 family competence protein, partial [Alphaproteobacteria bacterium]|nr:ComEC/Rec2 family competence protein [Alphaproteobacteria bacterium]